MIGLQIVSPAFLRAVLACSLLLLAACSSTDSGNVTSQGIGATMTVEATGDGTSDVEVHLVVGSGGLFNTDVQLENGDQLTATAGGVTKVLKEDHTLLGGYSYHTTFNLDTGGTEFVIAFNRAAETDAPDSHVTLPEAAAFTQPAANQSFNYGDQVQIAWDGVVPGGSLTLAYTTNCPTSSGASILSGSRSISDTGSYTITTASLVGDAALNTPAGESCTSDLDLSRTNKGHLDPNFGEGGSIKARQIRTRRISIQNLSGTGHSGF